MRFTTIRVNGAVYRLYAPPIYVQHRGATYRLALQAQQPVDEEDNVAHSMVRPCVAKHRTYGPLAKIWCVYPPTGDTSQFIGSHSTEEEAFKHAKMLLTRLSTLGIPITADMRTAVIKECLEKDKDDRPAAEQRICLYTHDGKKLLGRHPNKESAEKQEKAIQVSKHGSVPVLVRYKGVEYRLAAGQA